MFVDGEGRATLRDGSTGEHLGTVHPGAVHSTPLFRDADTLELHYADGSVYTWDTTVDHAVAVACRIAGGGLTRAEWRAVFGSRPYEDTCDLSRSPCTTGAVWTTMTSSIRTGEGSPGPPRSPG